MFRSSFVFVFICLIALVFAEEQEATLPESLRQNNRCPKFCFLRKPMNWQKQCGGWRNTEPCMRSGKSGRRCKCRTSRPTPRPTKPPARPSPVPSPMIPQVLACGSPVLSNGPAKLGMLTMRRTVNVKRNWGVFKFQWAAYEIPDMFVINQGGDKIFDSMYVMGTGENRVFLNGKGRNIAVAVTSKEAGSLWDFVATCADL